MLPSSLVVVRRYPVAGAYGHSGVGAGVGAEERTLLAKAGVESYVKLDRMGSVALVVPEAQAAAARRALSDSPDLFERHFAPPCPQCHTSHPGVRPPYEMVVVGIAFLASAAVVFANWPIGIAYALLAAGVIAGAAVYSHLPFWRCHACGYRYDTRSDQKGQVVRFPRRHQ